MIARKIDKFVAAHPKLYHMAEAGSWNSIREHGLLSVATLLDRFEIKGKRHSELFSAWRPSSVTIRHPFYGTAQVRDQHPMPPDKLRKVLKEGLLPSDWYETLNRKCFLWVDEERLNRMLNTALYRNKAHDVLTLDARRVLERDWEQITVSHINTGYVGRAATMRGPNTFHRIQECSRVGRKKGIAELTVEWGIPNIEEVVVSVQVRRGNKTCETIWPH